MSRDEARKRLKGTFGFKLDDGKVVVHDEALLSEIHEIIANPAEYGHTFEWSVRDANSRSVSFGAAA